MKKFTLLLAFFGLASCVGAQTIISSEDIGKPVEALDSVMYRITYNAQSVADTTLRDDDGNYMYGKDAMRLDIGRHLNKFYNYDAFVSDSLLTDAVVRGLDIQSLPHRYSTIQWTVFQNYPEGETTVFDHVWLDMYSIVEKTQLPDWKVVADSTANILGYHCTMATAHFKGRTWKAWFTEDIPLSYGPWKLCGLPGLVLKAVDATRQYAFEAVSMQQLDGKQPITPIKNKSMYETVTQKQFDKMKRETSATELLEAQGFSMKDAKIVGGDKDGVQKILKSVSPYNPIEVAE